MQIRNGIIVPFENGGSACSIKVVPAVEFVPVRKCRWPELDRPVVLDFARRDDPGESARILIQSADNGARFDIAPSTRCRGALGGQ